MDLITEIAARIPDTHLVMHGSSSLPADLREVINAHGGTLPESWGVPEHEKARSTKLGVAQDQPGHGLAHGLRWPRCAATGRGRDQRRSALYASTQVGVAMQQMVAERMQVFGQAGHAHDRLTSAVTTS